ncbi:DUF2057 domain-containing protein [Shewanella sp.]|nr:DUF2057 domain-containing protein [Shewanella sp.]
MRPLLPITAILALCSSSAALAANLNIPMAFEYIALDGKEIQTSLFSHKSSLALTEGTHKIAIRYHDLIEDDFSDSETTVKSSPFVITLKVDGDYEYQMQPAGGNNVKHPSQFAKSPNIVITRKGKGKVDYSVAQTNITEESFVSRLFSGNSASDVNLEAAAATSSASHSTAKAHNTSSPAVAVTQTVIHSDASSNSDAAQAEKMLQYWWLHADEKTRKEFMGWAIKQL